MLGLTLGAYLRLGCIVLLVAGGCGLYGKGRLDQKRKDDRASLLAQVQALKKDIADTAAVAEAWKASQAEKARVMAGLEEQIHDLADALSKKPEAPACEWTGDELDRLRHLGGSRATPLPPARPFQLRRAGPDAHAH